MKIYILVHHRSANEEWFEAIRGVFSTVEFAQSTYPGEWVEREAGYWEENHNRSISQAYILEYEVQGSDPQLTDNVLTELRRRNIDVG